MLDMGCTDGSYDPWGWFPWGMGIIPKTLGNISYTP